MFIVFYSIFGHVVYFVVHPTILSFYFVYLVVHPSLGFVIKSGQQCGDSPDWHSVAHHSLMIMMKKKKLMIMMIMTYIIGALGLVMIMMIILR